MLTVLYFFYQLRSQILHSVVKKLSIVHYFSHLKTKTGICEKSATLSMQLFQCVQPLLWMLYQTCGRHVYTAETFFSTQTILWGTCKFKCHKILHILHKTNCEKLVNKNRKEWLINIIDAFGTIIKEFEDDWEWLYMIHYSWCQEFIKCWYK